MKKMYDKENKNKMENGKSIYYKLHANKKQYLNENDIYNFPLSPAHSEFKLHHHKSLRNYRNHFLPNPVSYKHITIRRSMSQSSSDCMKKYTRKFFFHESLNEKELFEAAKTLVHLCEHFNKY